MADLITNYRNNNDPQFENTLEIPKVVTPRLKDETTQAPIQQPAQIPVTLQEQQLRNQTPQQEELLPTNQEDLNALLNQQLSTQYPTLTYGASNDDDRRGAEFDKWINDTIQQQQIEAVNNNASQQLPVPRPNQDGFSQNSLRAPLGTSKQETDVMTDGIIGNEFNIREGKFGQTGEGILGGIFYGLNMINPTEILKTRIMDATSAVGIAGVSLWDAGKAATQGRNPLSAFWQRYNDVYDTVFPGGAMYTQQYWRGRDFGALGAYMTGDAKDDYSRMYGKNPVPQAFDTIFGVSEKTRDNLQEFSGLSIARNTYATNVPVLGAAIPKFSQLPPQLEARYQQLINEQDGSQMNRFVARQIAAGIFDVFFDIGGLLKGRKPQPITGGLSRIEDVTGTDRVINPDVVPPTPNVDNPSGVSSTSDFITVDATATSFDREVNKPEVIKLDPEPTNWTVTDIQPPEKQLAPSGTGFKPSTKAERQQRGDIVTQSVDEVRSDVTKQLEALDNNINDLARDLGVELPNTIDIIPDAPVVIVPNELTNTDSVLTQTVEQPRAVIQIERLPDEWETPEKLYYSNPVSSKDIQPVIKERMTPLLPPARDLVQTVSEPIKLPETVETQWISVQASERGEVFKNADGTEYKRITISCQSCSREVEAYKLLEDSNLTPRLISNGTNELVIEGLKGATYTSLRPSMGQGDFSDTPKLIGERLKLMHEKGVAHGDLHGSNLFISEDGTPKFIDFETAIIKGDYRFDEARKLDERRVFNLFDDKKQQDAFDSAYNGSYVGDLGAWEVVNSRQGRVTTEANNVSIRRTFDDFNAFTNESDAVVKLKDTDLTARIELIDSDSITYEKLDGAPLDKIELFPELVQLLGERVRQLHSSGVIHEDLHFGNALYVGDVMMDNDTIKFIDFENSTVLDGLDDVSKEKAIQGEIGFIRDELEYINPELVKAFDKGYGITQAQIDETNKPGLVHTKVKQAVQSGAAEQINAGQIKVTNPEAPAAKRLEEVAVDLTELNGEYDIREIPMLLSRSNAAPGIMTFNGKVKEPNFAIRTVDQILRLGSLIPHPQDPTRPLIPPSLKLAQKFEETYGIPHPYAEYARKRTPTKGRIEDVTDTINNKDRHKSIAHLAVEAGNNFGAFYQRILDPSGSAISDQLLEKIERGAASGEGIVIKTARDTYAMLRQPKKIEQVVDTPPVIQMDDTTLLNELTRIDSTYNLDELAGVVQNEIVRKGLKASEVNLIEELPSAIEKYNKDGGVVLDPTDKTNPMYNVNVIDKEAIDAVNIDLIRSKILKKGIELSGEETPEMLLAISFEVQKGHYDVNELLRNNMFRVYTNYNDFYRPTGKDLKQVIKTLEGSSNSSEVDVSPLQNEVADSIIQEEKLRTGLANIEEARREIETQKEPTVPDTNTPLHDAALYDMWDIFDSTYFTSNKELLKFVKGAADKARKGRENWKIDKIDGVSILYNNAELLNEYRASIQQNPIPKFMLPDIKGGIVLVDGEKLMIGRGTILGITLGDKKPMIVLPRAGTGEATSTPLHEAVHATMLMLRGKTATPEINSAWERINRLEPTFETYGKTMAAEEIATTMQLYVENPDVLRIVMPLHYEFANTFYTSREGADLVTRQSKLPLHWTPEVKNNEKYITELTIARGKGFEQGIRSIVGLDILSQSEKIDAIQALYFLETNKQFRIGKGVFKLDESIRNANTVNDTMTLRGLQPQTSQQLSQILSSRGVSSKNKAYASAWFVNNSNEKLPQFSPFEQKTRTIESLKTLELQAREALEVNKQQTQQTASALLNEIEQQVNTKNEAKKTKQNQARKQARESATIENENFNKEQDCI